jgi:hypothetical protein
VTSAAATCSEGAGGSAGRTGSGDRRIGSKRGASGAGWPRRVWMKRANSPTGSAGRGTLGSRSVGLG